nr:MAG TPA: hypothetical protein [Caudoviricetes sp.]
MLRLVTGIKFSDPSPAIASLLYSIFFVSNKKQPEKGCRVEWKGDKENS